MAVCRMSEILHHHIPVLLKETVEQLMLSPQGIYIDATFGRGSHSRAILECLNTQGRLIAFDKDPEAVSYAKQHFTDPRFTIVHGSFTQMQSYAEQHNLLGAITGVLFDLGVSSPQLDNAERGFSFSRDGKLDMRMDTTQGIDAMSWLSEVEEEELANVLWQYGEEKFYRRIARAIVTARTTAPIQTTSELAELILSAVPKIKGKWDKHPATRSFQAIRIAINQELTELEQALNQAVDVLMVGGRLLAISFHSLEDRIVKQFIKQHEKGQDLPRGLPIKGSTFNAKLASVGKPIKPSLQEIQNNPRARSAILRIAEKRS